MSKKTTKKAKRQHGTSDSKKLLGTFWLFFDASDKYTGHTLWPSRKMAQDEMTYESLQGRLPDDGVWRIKKVVVQIVT